MRLPLLLLLLFLGSLHGCSSLINNATSSVADSLTLGMLSQDDPEIVKQGAPAYLIMVDGFIAKDPENVTLLRAGAELYGAYASGFADGIEREKKLSSRAFDYAQRAACLDLPAWCSIRTQAYDQIAQQLNTMDSNEDLPSLYSLASSWAGWIKAHTDDWNAIADVAKVQLMMEKAIALDETYKDGSAHLYLGVLKAQVPPSLGGKPEEARAHFERAFELSQQLNLMARVFEAEYYARMLFDEELHARLLNEVLNADVDSPQWVLSNTLAKQRARELLDSAKDYF